MTQPVHIPGGRSVRGTLDQTATAADAVVIACPPHPEHGGDRHDSRLRAVSDALGGRGWDCLRVDYGAFDGGRGEQTDIQRAVWWARSRYDRVGLFGYSFGGAVALLTAARVAAGPGGDTDTDANPNADADTAASVGSAPAVDRVAVLAPASSLSAKVDVVAAVAGIDGPLQVVYGTRDETVEVGPVASQARRHGASVTPLPADHFFIGQRSAVATTVAEFLAPTE